MQQMQQLKQNAQQVPMTPDAQVLLQTSMAETQRRAVSDQAQTQLAQARLALDQQRMIDVIYGGLAYEGPSSPWVFCPGAN